MAIKEIWTTPGPLVIDKVTLSEFLNLVVYNHGPSSTILVCSTKELFLQNLCSSIIQDCHHNNTTTGTSTDPIDLATQQSEDEHTRTRDGPIQHHLLTPTLHLLSSSRSLKVVFCPDVPHTLAYLSHLSLDTTPPQPDRRRPLLAIIDPISQHKGTLSFSAQDLAKFFSQAVETAHATGAKLVVAECSHGSREYDADDEDLFAAEGGARRDAGSVWDEQVSILNVTTKTFGAGDKGWQGRSVSLRRIAGRWCEFYSPPST
ncbi:hypothetical protein ANO11243_030480 [Dothideomycetidae sp. 11243]|nr:hypothetical protein ANO11243_030480 [fungal sp. No.11243]